MSFVARNHPQQVTGRGPLDFVDDRETPAEVFGPLNERFQFTIDVAASDQNSKLERYWTVEHNALLQSWEEERVWCNPPYSDITSWVVKAWDQWEWESGGVAPELIVMLLPANRTEQKWWQEYVEPNRDKPGGRFHVEFLPGRMRFIAPGDTSIKPNARPPFGCCLLIWETTTTH